MKPILFALVLFFVSASHVRAAGDETDLVAALDTRFQAAVKANDSATQADLLADDFVLALGDGRTFSKQELIKGQTEGIVWEQQDEEPGSRTVRQWGDTAVVTAKLWMKGIQNGKPFDRKLWFSDVYVKTAGGWRYVFGQASLQLPPGK